MSTPAALPPSPLKVLPFLKLISVVAFCALLLLGTFNSTDYATLKSLGLLAIIALLASAQLLLLGRLFLDQRLPKCLLPILAAAILLCSVYSVSLLRHGSDGRGLYVLVQLLLLLGFFICIILLRRIQWLITALAVAQSLFVIAVVAAWTVSGFPAGFSFYFGNANALGSFAFFGLFFILAGYYQSKRPMLRQIYRAAIIASLLALLASNVRSLLLVGFIMLGTAVCWRFLVSRRKLFTLYLVFVISVICVFTYVYPTLATDPDWLVYDEIIYQYSNKSLFSGRQAIWSVLLEAVAKQPLFGYGVGTLPADVFPYESPYAEGSAHNLYLQITLQVGFVGLGALFLLIGAIWHAFRVRPTNKITIIAAAYFIGLLFHQTFEVTLTQNNLSIGLLQWLILAVGLNVALTPANYTSIKHTKSHRLQGYAKQSPSES